MGVVRGVVVLEIIGVMILSGVKGGGAKEGIYLGNDRFKGCWVNICNGFI